ncbi:hypothetical protein [Actinocorallia populi]|uniref:hypothetical protein n=1 Tax=Actinocorallia populi TaxID=2079200 RepID=UPI001300665B|nr:hypothetical protein [Actinocorallia populi]
MTTPPKRPKTKRQALVLFGAGAAVATVVCALVASLPDPRREAVNSGSSRSAGSVPPGTPPPAADVSVTLDGRTLRIHNRGPQGTGPVTLDLHRLEGRLRASCVRTGCAWPDLPSGGSVEIRVRGEGRGSAEVHTTVPDRSPDDNEVPLLLPSRGPGVRPAG